METICWLSVRWYITMVITDVSDAIKTDFSFHDANIYITVTWTSQSVKWNGVT